MSENRPYAKSLNMLRSAKLRPTRQRLALTKLLFEGGDRHVTAEDLHEDAVANGVRVSLATIYNTLHQFTAAGLLREVMVTSEKSYFDTNVAPHHHFFIEDAQRLVDIPGDQIAITALPDAPEGTEIRSVDVVIRLASI
jgi:Fur family iron response transcriptional regulator